MTNLTITFAERIFDIQSTTLSDADLEQLHVLIFDLIGVAYGGAQRPWVAAMHHWAHPYAGTGKSSVCASEMRVPPTIAALINGTAAHSFELDDTHDASLSHPGAVVIPAAIAVAETIGAGGAEFLAAIVAGYETMARLGMAANIANVIGHGHHPTAILGVFGAATAASILYKLDFATSLQAWGHALSLSAGSMQFSDEPFGTTVKRLHAGYPAHNGILAAEMARAGVSAPQQAIDGRYGFLHLFGRDVRPETLLETPPRLAIHDISLKPYACCRQFHAVIDGLDSVTKGRASSSIRRIVVRGPSILYEQHMIRRPESPMAAQYSLPFVIGATLEFGATRFDVFEQDYLNHEGILRWGDIITVEHDSSLEAEFPAHLGAEVEVTFDGGSIGKKRVLDSLGTRRSPLSWQYLTTKISALTRGAPRSFEVDRAQRMIQGLPDAGTAAFHSVLSGRCRQPERVSHEA